jgi:hypothetical protein
MKITRENLARHLVEYELEMVGKSMMDTLHDDEWFTNNTMTNVQHEDFKKYSIKLIKKIFRCNSAKALKTFDWFDFSFGLKIKN